MEEPDRVRPLLVGIAAADLAGTGPTSPMAQTLSHSSQRSTNSPVASMPSNKQGVLPIPVRRLLHYRMRKYRLRKPGGSGHLWGALPAVVKVGAAAGGAGVVVGAGHIRLVLKAAAGGNRALAGGRAKASVALRLERGWIIAQAPVGQHLRHGLCLTWSKV